MLNKGPIAAVIHHYKEFLAKGEFPLVKESVDFLKSVLLNHEKQTYVSFNGGKDATIVLYLTVLAYHELDLPLSSIKTIYFEEPNPFPQLEKFIKETESDLGIKPIRTDKANFSESLKILKMSHPIDYIIMGTRRTDPYCSHLLPLSKSDTDKGYPDFMRVNPILDWSYAFVWKFLRDFEVPFCELYKQGYTYLGNRDNTKPNESLFVQGQNRYRPAWEAVEENELLSRKRG